MQVNNYIWLDYFKKALSPVICSMSIVLTANAFPEKNETILIPQEDGSFKSLNNTQRVIKVNDTSEVLNTDGSYQLRVGNNMYSRSRQSSPLIQLRGGVSFDPLQVGNHITSQQTRTLAPQLYSPTNNEIEAYIIQFNTQALPAYQQALRDAGADVTIAIPPNAIIALMSASTKSTIEALPFVRAAVHFLPAYKLQKGLDTLIASGDSEIETYSIMSVTKAHRDQLMAFTQSIGGEIIQNNSSQVLSEGSRFTSELTTEQLYQVSQRAETLFIDVRGKETEDLDQVREREGFSHVETVAGYCGQGVGLEVYDLGFRLTHQELANKPILVRSPAAAANGIVFHGTQIAGMMYANGIAMAKGLIHCAARPIVFSMYSGFPNTNHPTEAQLRGHLSPLVDPNGRYRAIAQTSSADYPRTLDYTTWSAEYDEVLFDLDFVKLQSQSNSGDQMSRPTAWAKNVVSVGGFVTANTIDRSDDSWTSASIGPAADDRIKPDLSGQYSGIRTSNSSSDSAYSEFGGTSGATPIVAGTFGIMFQMWADGVFDGGPGKNRDVFTARPHASTAKALMVHSAYRYAFSGGDNANMSRVHQGWGSPDLKNLYETAKANGWGLPILVNETDTINPGATNSYSLTVTGTQPLKATLVYTDLRGNPAAAIHRINDLTLRATSPSGIVYWGNNGLRAGNWSTPAGTSNTIDTVENVFIQAPEAGTWKIDVLGDDIIQDAHPATTAIDAVYALLASGGTSSTTPTNQAPKVNAGNDKNGTAGVAITLNGTASDDGRPNPPGALTVSWSKISGPGTVVFSNASSAVTDATFSVDGNYVVRLTASDSALSSNDTVNISIGSVPTVLEAQSFEIDQGQWQNVTAGDNNDWTRNSGGTFSRNTGPNSGSNGSSWYMYMETSNGSAYNPGDSAILEGPSITGSARTLSFDYHMYGLNMGTLNVDVQSGGTFKNVWSLSGQQHTSNSAAYTQATVDLGAYSGAIKIRFRAVAAGSWQGDVAIDNIKIKGIAGAVQ